MCRSLAILLPMNVSRDPNIGSSEMCRMLEKGPSLFPSPVFSLGNAVAETATGNTLVTQKLVFRQSSYWYVSVRTA